LKVNSASCWFLLYGKPIRVSTFQRISLTVLSAKRNDDFCSLTGKK